MAYGGGGGNLALVFQYGSNCSSERLNSPDRLNGSATPQGLAETMEHFELRFDVWSNGNNCAASDIIPGGDAPVQGVLYEVPDELMGQTARLLGRRSFDSIEGNAYERQMIRVRKRDGTVTDAVTYVVREPARNLLTSAEYVGHILTGLREHGADENYIQSVKQAAIRNNPEIEQHIAGL